MNQLQALVKYMEENPEFARGAPVFGASKFSIDEKWNILSQKLNSMGPPTCTIADWKKTSADLKSRTKKKISENKRSLNETGGGLYRFNSLTKLEEAIDRTLLLSSTAATTGREFGCSTRNVGSQSIEDCFQSLVETPPRNTKAVAVVTPSRLNAASIDTEPLQHNNQHERKRRHSFNSDDEHPSCSTAKKKKTNVDEQLALIRRQLRFAEASAANAREQAQNIKRLADAAELRAESAKRQADAAEIQAECFKALLKATQNVEKLLENISAKIN